MIRWLAAVLGYTFFRFPGAILGFLLGSLIDNMIGGKKSGGRGFQQVFQQRSEQVSPADFELNLLSLASLVIKADGVVNQKELDYVRQYFVQAYGKERANATFKVFNEVIKNRQVSAANICALLRSRTRYESRLQLLHFLFSIANADGHVTQSEVNEINNIARYLGIQLRDFESIKAMFFQNPDSAYKILEIEKTATVSEIKSAYRTMAKKYHPDKLVHMDEAYQKGAEEKFRKVQEAYEQLQKERGF
ncbi:MAG TPA: molecular chaperone DjiA [Flavobacteriaceae bacterium]|jgi:DnaJ like chaperone protein|nr:molecular chaperone DjlA [Flavobacteriaceae bacterium]HBR55272.1 molecular chaperone DjlA [Flavobacteriaceae bacterium]HIB47560.1 molecular chaperone DjiA [Flavobacteriaceae bacterium]HIN98920.1 molecular chaperone DjiA [Flavobacteriaceae bacterium]|tara:strand:- start:60389 stop:61132 length:744 start_codon:yes stop_codon:yes gene_type:complete